MVLDIDDTVDVVHGHQQLAQWNAHYDERCFLPIHVYDVATGAPVVVILRPGKTPSGVEVRKLLSRLIGRIRRHWPSTHITIRGDGHYGREEAMTWCENYGIDYIFGLSGNVVLDRLVEAAARLIFEIVPRVLRGPLGYGCSAVGYPRALVELNRENSGTPLSHVLAIADDVPAKFEREFDLYVFGVVKENLPTGDVVHAVARLASVVLLHRLKGRGCQMQLPRAGGKFWPRPPSYSDPAPSLQFVLPSFANELR